VQAWRWLLTAVLAALIGLPLALPVVELTQQPAAWQAWEAAARLRELAANSCLLVGGVLALALPVGTAGAVLLYRSDLPGRRGFRMLVVLSLFVPLPLFASAWQATLGAGGLFPTVGWLATAPGAPSAPGFPPRYVWQPWAQGIGAAIWVHAMAGLPWVVWLVGQGLCWVERSLEEDALTVAAPWRVLLGVTLPRCRAALAAAALIVGVQTATEITVTDLMQVRTFAEEVYLQFSLQDPLVLARAVAVCLPLVLLVMTLTTIAAARWERGIPALDELAEPLVLIRLGRARGSALGAALLAAAMLTGVPVVGLVWKAGLGGSPEAWSAGRFFTQLGAAAQGKASLVLANFLLAAAAGALAALLALTTCWLAVESRWYRRGMLVLLAAALALPGPVVGIGLKATIDLALSGEELLGLGTAGPLRRLLYDGPSLLPILWAVLVRFLPVAVVVLWPAVRLIPRELRETARLDGAAPSAELLRVVLPVTRPACRRAAVAVGVLTLGEIGASKLVETPGSTTLAHVIFEQMHRGVPADVAALCLLLLLTVVLGSAFLPLANRTGT